MPETGPGFWSIMLHLYRMAEQQTTELRMFARIHRHYAGHCSGLEHGTVMLCISASLLSLTRLVQDQVHGTPNSPWTML